MLKYQVVLEVDTLWRDIQGSFREADEGGEWKIQD